MCPALSKSPRCRRCDNYAEDVPAFIDAAMLATTDPQTREHDVPADVARSHRSYDDSTNTFVCPTHRERRTV